MPGANGYQRPSGEESQAMTATQEDIEYFTHITFEAPGESRYAWMNTVVPIDVMAMIEGKPVIDCYRLTNFPGRGTAHL